MSCVKNMIDEYIESFENAIAKMVQDIDKGLLFWDIIDCFANDEINESLLKYGIIESADTYRFIIDVLYDYLNDNYISIADIVFNLAMLGYDLDVYSIFDNIININVIQCIQGRY